MDPDEIGYRDEIKTRINELLWSMLPSSATMKEAEEVAIIMWENIIELREKYECTGSGS